MEPRDSNPNNDVNVGQWVDGEMAALGPHENWQPDMHRGLLLLREQRAKRTGRRRRWTWAVAAATAASLSLMATPSTRAFAERCLDACVSQTGWVRQLLVAGPSAPAPSSVYIKPQDRKMAPDFTLNDLSGKLVTLSQLRGDVVLLNFWATWCAPCRMEIPMFIAFQQAYRDRDFVVLGVSLDDGGSKVVRPYVDAKRMDYPVMVGDDRISNLFGGLKAIPTTLIIDRQGRVAATHIGLCQKSEYERDIRTALNE
jgi:cytochrome c biogenesis protein CcmG/thiol:disulfide interchange protein DsbE